MDEKTIQEAIDKVHLRSKIYAMLNGLKTNGWIEISEPIVIPSHTRIDFTNFNFIIREEIQSSKETVIK